ncbi:MAG: nitrous oxide reductase accessory protein NosL [Verrucomicrobia bacterium]|nr:nitrous oxide reductase accessory protein NosL [Deltaproteobacteria bacterium]
MKLKYGAVCVIALVLLGITVAAVVAGNDIDEYRSCNHCGMDRKAYGYSRMMLTYENGSRVGVCSLHCAVTEMNGHKGSAVKTLLVADRTSHAMIEAEKAFWVVGGSKRGVMTQNPKWAFATKDAAQAFVDSNGGKITNWDAALLAAREDAAPITRHR